MLTLSQALTSHIGSVEEELPGGWYMGRFLVDTENVLIEDFSPEVPRHRAVLHLPEKNSTL